MKIAHIVAVVCFVVAGLLYAFASSGAVAAGFGALGFVFEIVGWVTVADAFKDGE